MTKIERDENIVEAPRRELKLPVRYVLIPPKLATKVNVENIEKVKFINTAPVTVTEFTNIQDGQTLFILGDGQTTLANNTKIVTNTGANKLLVNGLVHVFVVFDKVAREIK